MLVPWAVRHQSAGYPKPEQRRGRAEASAADDGDGGHLEELRHDGRHRGAGVVCKLEMITTQNTSM